MTRIPFHSRSASNARDASDLHDGSNSDHSHRVLLALRVIVGTACCCCHRVLFAPRVITGFQCCHAVIACCYWHPANGGAIFDILILPGHFVFPKFKFFCVSLVTPTRYIRFARIAWLFFAPASILKCTP